MLLSFEPIHLYISLAVLAAALTGLWVLGKDLSYLFFFAIFGIYLIGVVSVVIFPIYIPERGTEAIGGLQFNLTPFYFDKCDFLCLRLIYENILLTIPFGFGIHFISRVKRQNIIWLAGAVGLALELIQMIISLFARSPFRVFDINDVFFNAIGVLAGYGLFRIFGWLYLYMMQRFGIPQNYLFAYIYEVTRRSTDT